MLRAEWTGEWSTVEKKEIANIPLETPTQTSRCSNSLASSLNVRPGRHICLPSNLPRSLLSFFFFLFALQLLGKSMFFPCSLHPWNVTSFSCLLWQHQLNKDRGRGNKSFSERRGERLLKKRKFISLCTRKTSFAWLHHFLFFTSFLDLIFKNIWQHWTIASLKLFVPSFLPDYVYPLEGKFLSSRSVELSTRLLQKRYILCAPLVTATHFLTLGFCLPYSIEIAPVQITIGLFFKK